MHLPTTLKYLITVGVALALGVVTLRVADTTLMQAVSADWPRANGFIRQSQVVPSQANPFIDDLDLEYTYQVGTQWAVGDRLTFFGRTLSMIFRVGSADEMSQALPEGAPIEVAYDPANPERAVLSPGITGVEFGAAALVVLGIGGIAVGMFTHGAAGLLASFRQARGQTGHPMGATIRGSTPSRPAHARAA